jgi:ketosteroid isomerase-like protein
MKARTLLLAVLALAFASTACQPPAQEAPGLSEEDVAAIRTVMEAGAEAEEAGDWAALVALGTEDFVWMPPNVEILEGRAAIIAFVEESGLQIQESLVSATEIDGRGDLAYFRATYRLRMSFGDAEPITDVGKWIAILRKQADGSWLHSAWIWNSDLPLPEGGSET